MRAGEELRPVRSRASDRVDMVRMALLLRDPNPLHLDRVYAQERGFADSVQQGPIHAGWATEAVASWLPTGWRLDRLRIRFLDNVFPGDVVETTGVVAAIREGEVEIEFEQAKAGGGRTLTGRAVAVSAAGGR
jgi:acyl dehydratase